MTVLDEATDSTDLECEPDVQNLWTCPSGCRSSPWTSSELNPEVDFGAATKLEALRNFSALIGAEVY